MIEHDMIGRRVRLLMAAKRMTQRDLARTAGISVAAVNKICKGGSDLTLRTLLGVADGLGIDLAELLLPPGHAIIEAPEQAGVVQWLPTTPLGSKFPPPDPAQPLDIAAALERFRRAPDGIFESKWSATTPLGRRFPPLDPAQPADIATTLERFRRAPERE